MQKNTQENNYRNPKWKIKDLCYENIYGPALFPAQRTVEKDYSAFKDYINNATQAAKMREGVSAKFFRVDNQKEFILSKWYVLDINSKIINNQVVSDSSKIQAVESLGFDVVDIPLKSIESNGKKIDFKIHKGSAYFSSEKIDKLVINRNEEISYDLRQYSPEFVEYKGQKINVRNGKVYIEDSGDAPCYDIFLDFITFELYNTQSGKKENTVIIELEDDESLEVSVFDTFFSEDVEDIYFGKDKYDKYKIKRKFKEFGQLELYVNKGKSIPNEGTINISTNTYQLMCQTRAIDILINSPSQYHKALLYLSDDKQKAELDPFNAVNEMNIDFKVLTREDLKGNTNQRKFVKKALQTPDFMILEGPPGSGKTTTILEFIYQVLKEGKKVMLSASTHVAIDNVLEKILTHKDSKELLKYINPVRIGSEDNIYVDEVKQFTYENIMSGISSEYHQMVEDSFNLVCGTTIGILQYPLFKKTIGDNRGNMSTIEPVFDYLIIDEASKTTFNEFLVPAIFAKKWIIVGDVKQLAPYVEKNDLVPTLLNSKALKTKSLREAIYFLMMISKMRKTDLSNKAFMMSGSTIQYLDKYLDSDSYIAVTSLKTENLFTISNDDIKSDSYKLCALDSANRTILIDDSLAKKVIPLLNTKTLVVGKSKNIAREIYFEEYAILHHRFNDFYKRTNELDDRYSKRLEDEILWRLIRIYELAHSDTVVTEKYETYIEDVKKHLDEKMLQEYDKTIAMISEIALPSIITLLQQGIKKRSFNTKDTILNSGFSEIDKVNRFESLEYQYRMHQEISMLPRKLVYNDQALKDDKRTYDEFKYFKNESRFIVLDVNGATVTRNQNEKEAKVILEHLEEIAKYAKNQDIRYEIAILSFYNGQVSLLRKILQRYFKSNAKYNFSDGHIKVSLNTVDKFQGQEADIVFLSMVQNSRVGFMDSINRVNVAVTRAKEKLILVGDKKYFATTQNESVLLKYLFKGGVK
ncbi:MAG: AAA domain-containing protein [Candidatus Izemoplasmatales bacterium]|nr:AAA domain-containing protein [Candidatus Izemoplasmatales bacterium]